MEPVTERQGVHGASLLLRAEKDEGLLLMKDEVDGRLSVQTLDDFESQKSDDRFSTKLYIHSHSHACVQVE